MKERESLFLEAVNRLTMREVRQFEDACRAWNSVPDAEGEVRREMLVNLFVWARCRYLGELAERLRVGDADASSYVEAQLAVLRAAMRVQCKD